MEHAGMGDHETPSELDRLIERLAEAKDPASVRAAIDEVTAYLTKRQKEREKSKIAEQWKADPTSVE
jgi:hypothetical protein